MITNGAIPAEGHHRLHGLQELSHVHVGENKTILIDDSVPAYGKSERNEVAATPPQTVQQSLSAYENFKQSLKQKSDLTRQQITANPIHAAVWSMAIGTVFGILVRQSVSRGK